MDVCDRVGKTRSASMVEGHRKWDLQNRHADGITASLHSSQNTGRRTPQRHMLEDMTSEAFKGLSTSPLETAKSMTGWMLHAGIRRFRRSPLPTGP